MYQRHKGCLFSICLINTSAKSICYPCKHVCSFNKNTVVKKTKQKNIHKLTYTESHRKTPKPDLDVKGVWVIYTYLQETKTRFNQKKITQHWLYSVDFPSSRFALVIYDHLIEKQTCQLLAGSNPLRAPDTDLVLFYVNVRDASLTLCPQALLEVEEFRFKHHNGPLEITCLWLHRLWW